MRTHTETRTHSHIYADRAHMHACPLACARTRAHACTCTHARTPARTDMWMRKRGAGEPSLSLSLSHTHTHTHTHTMNHDELRAMSIAVHQSEHHWTKTSVTITQIRGNRQMCQLNCLHHFPVQPRRDINPDLHYVKRLGDYPTAQSIPRTRTFSGHRCDVQ
jgi:hypothetical protein